MESKKKLGMPDSFFTKQSLGQHIDFYQKYYNVKIKKPLKPFFEITSENWSKHLGRYENWPNFYAFFIKQKLNSEDVLLPFLSKLGQHPDTALFHCLIRFSIAYQDKNPKEIAMSLAYWCSILPNKQTVAPYPIQVLPSFTAKIQRVINQYTLSQNFVSLHLITSYTALLHLPKSFQKLILPYYMSQVILLSQDFTMHKPPSVAWSDNLWNQALEKAKNSHDEHIIKILVALKQLRSRTNLHNLGGASQSTLKANFM